MRHQWDFVLPLRYAPLFWRGVLVTLVCTAVTIFVGLIIGLAVGLGRLSRSRLANIPLVAFIEALRCTPLLVRISAPRNKLVQPLPEPASIVRVQIERRSARANPPCFLRPPLSGRIPTWGVICWKPSRANALRTGMPGCNGLSRRTGMGNGAGGLFRDR